MELWIVALVFATQRINHAKTQLEVRFLPRLPEHRQSVSRYL